MFLFAITFFIMLFLLIIGLQNIYYIHYDFAKQDFITSYIEKSSYVDNIFSIRTFLKLNYEKSVNSDSFVNYPKDLYFYSDNYIDEKGIPFLGPEQYQIAQESYGIHTISFLENTYVYLDALDPQNHFVFSTSGYNSFLIFKCSDSERKILVVVSQDKAQPTGYLKGIEVSLLNNAFPLRFMHSGYYSTLIYSEGGISIKTYQNVGKLLDSVGVCISLENSKKAKEYILEFVKIINKKDSKYYVIPVKLTY